MTKIKSFSELQNLKRKYISDQNKSELSERVAVIKIGMATCGIASGAKEIKKVMEAECEYQAIDAQICQTGCLGYCYAEPMVEVIMPDGVSKVFGYVDKSRAKEIIEKYIMRSEKVEGEIEISFQTIND